MALTATSRGGGRRAFAFCVEYGCGGLHNGHRCPAELRFWAQVEKDNGCWLWTGAVNSNGYGVFSVSTGTKVYAHRYALELVQGALRNGSFACHHCDTPRCVRPDHLFSGTASENMRDASRKGRLVNVTTIANRAKVRCNKGHEFTPQNTYADRNRRACRACRRARQAQSRRRRSST